MGVGGESECEERGSARSEVVGGETSLHHSALDRVEMFLLHLRQRRHVLEKRVEIAQICLQLPYPQVQSEASLLALFFSLVVLLFSLLSSSASLRCPSMLQALLSSTLQISSIFYCYRSGAYNKPPLFYCLTLQVPYPACTQLRQ